ncbi:hypothetical protein ST47_g9037 [Ascochyta rabiei]|uniref:Uncharacterized protein n=1 Tax=Didymella rabiei TaxID=5454 RepID=A0A162Y9K9_DIDRA|nr:hypothetical protein ST47_g9037 [Ascochyta rabiei]
MLVLKYSSNQPTLDHTVIMLVLKYNPSIVQDNLTVLPYILHADTSQPDPGKASSGMRRAVVQGSGVQQKTSSAGVRLECAPCGMRSRASKRSLNTIPRQGRTRFRGSCWSSASESWGTDVTPIYRIPDHSGVERADTCLLAAQHFSCNRIAPHHLHKGNIFAPWCGSEERPATGKAVHDREVCESQNPDAIHRLALDLTAPAAPMGLWSATLVKSTSLPRADS